jgi:hypothetical protein
MINEEKRIALIRRIKVGIDYDSKLFTIYIDIMIGECIGCCLYIHDINAIIDAGYDDIYQCHACYVTAENNQFGASSSISFAGFVKRNWLK